jgi:hypothetical protein
MSLTGCTTQLPFMRLILKADISQWGTDAYFTAEVAIEMAKQGLQILWKVSQA